MIVPLSPSLMREQSHPEVYLVFGGMKLWITSPSELFALGFDWSRVQVVPDGTLDAWLRATLGPYGVTAASGVMFGDAASAGDSANNLKDSRAIIKRDILVAGWLVMAPDRNRTFATEDYHYNVILDVDFMMQMYGNGGLSSTLNGAVLPGNLSQSGTNFTWPTLRFDDVSEKDGSSRGVTMNSFALPHMGGSLLPDTIGCINNSNPSQSTPGAPLSTDPLERNHLGYCDAQSDDFLQAGPVYAHGELNTWHINFETGFLTAHYNGRGTPPTGWVSDPGPNPMPAGWVQDANEAYPFNPHNPDNGPRDLQAGDYIMMRGTLWQEHAHDVASPSLWRAIPALLGHVGLVEMHPIDWIQRLQPPAVPKTAYMVACCCLRPSKEGIGQFQDRLFDVTLLPYPKPAALPSPIFNCTELIDGRYSDMNTVAEHTTIPPCNQKATDPTINQLAVHVHLKSTYPEQARFKAVYLMWWQPPLVVSVTPTQTMVGTRVTLQAHAQDGTTGQTVACRIKLAGQDVGSTDSAISFVFERLDVTGTVSAPAGSGYPDVPLTFQLSPGKLTIDVTFFIPNKPVQVTVSARNAAGENVNGGIVSIANQPVGQTNVPFTYTFHPSYAGPPGERYLNYPSGTVSAPGYQTATINFNDYGAGGGP